MGENRTAQLASEPTSGQGTEEGPKTRISPRIIVQGSAYYIVLFGDRHRTQMLDEISQAAKKGYDKLTQEDGTAVDAVEEAVRFLEASKYFNAGRGSLLNNDGEVECDAMIMDGHTMNTGAVMGARHFSNPVSLSRKIMDESYHCALSGEGALRFAERIGFPICDPKDLIDEEIKERTKALTYERYKTFVDNYDGKPVPESEPESEPESVSSNYDSVSAVALDSNGYFACATSTGGIPGKLKGRIGDAALVGCGGYANEHGAAAVGGHGEAIMKMTLAREVVYNIEKGENAQESAENALQQMGENINARGRAIAIDKKGILGKEMNSTAMLWATMDDNELQCGMERKKALGTRQQRSHQKSLEDEVEDQVCRLCKMKLSHQNANH